MCSKWRCLYFTKFDKSHANYTDTKTLCWWLNMVWRGDDPVLGTLQWLDQQGSPVYTDLFPDFPSKVWIGTKCLLLLFSPFVHMDLSVLEEFRVIRVFYPFKSCTWFWSRGECLWMVLDSRLRCRCFIGDLYLDSCVQHQAHNLERTKD